MTKRIIVIVFFGLLFVGQAVSASIESKRFIDVQVGRYLFDDKRNISDRTVFSSKYRQFLSSPWAFELGVNFVPSDLDGPGLQTSLDLIRPLRTERKDWMPYLAAGGAVSFMDRKDIVARTGAGFYLPINRSLLAVVDFRQSVFLRTRRTDSQVTFGLSYEIVAPQAPEPVVIVEAEPTPDVVVVEVVEPVVLPVDSDFDGVLDDADACPDTFLGAEVDATGCLVSLTLDIKFSSGSSVVSVDYAKALEKYAIYIKAQPNKQFEIQGHSDSTGRASSNLALSRKRAQSVYNVLVAQYSVNPQQLVVKGYGSQFPKYDNKTREGRSKNRRIEMIILQ